MSLTTMRLALIVMSLVAFLGLAFTATVLYINRAEFFDLPGLSYEDHTVIHSQQEQDGGAGKDAFQMYWADGLVQGKPYSALVVSDTVWMLGDGNRIHRQSKSRYFRDRAGHLRLEQGVNDDWIPDSLKPVHTRVFFEDAAGDKSYIRWDGKERSSFTPARGSDYNLAFARAKGVAVLGLPELNDAQDIRQTGLGVKEIDGLKCRGMRENITIPAGRIGNDRPIYISSEIWYAPSIAAVVQSMVKDPRMGEISYKLEEVQLGEPKQKLTEPPAAPVKK